MFVNGMAPRGGGDPPLPNGRRIRECRRLTPTEIIIVVILVFITGIAALGITVGVNCLRLVFPSSSSSDLTSNNHSSNITVRYYSGEPNDDFFVCTVVMEYTLGHAILCFIIVLYFACRVLSNYHRERQARPTQETAQGNALEAIELNVSDNAPTQVQRRQEQGFVRRSRRVSLRQLFIKIQIFFVFILGLILVLIGSLCLNSIVGFWGSKLRNIWKGNAYCGATSVLEIVCSVAFFAIAACMLLADNVFEPIEVEPIENNYEPVMVEGNDREDSPPPLED